MKYRISLILLLLIIKINSQTYDYYVSPNGNDISGNGSSLAPFKSIEKVRNFVRANKPDPMFQDLIIHLESGIYNLDSTLLFNNLDSGNNNHYIIYEGDSTNKPTLSGGKDITGWEKLANKNIYKASIGSLYSRQLYINNIKAVRARSNDISGNINNLGLVETSVGYFFSCPDISGWTNIRDIEIVSNMHWRSRRIPVSTICNNQFIIDNTIWEHFVHNNSMNFKTAPVEWIENAFELLDQPNEWYIDRLTNSASNIVYLVSDNTPINVIIPGIQYLINGNDVKNVKFKNINFSYSTWNDPSKQNIYLPASNYGFCNEQADYYKDVGGNQHMIPSSISFTNSSNINFINDEFEHIGSTALSFEQGSSNNKICGNKFEDIAASAIRVGVLDYSNINFINNNDITNNTINNIANEYYGSVGIFVPYAKNTTIKNNTLSNFPYSGISVGWGWNINHNVGVNTINNNKIDCTHQILSDGGGIYTLNAQGDNNNKTQITGNYIINQRFYQGAIYLDQQSSFVDVSNNLIDANNLLDIPNKVNCMDNPVTSISLWYGSTHVNIHNNYYNASYHPPSDGSNCDYNHPCSNINLLNNINITSTDPISQNIIDNSGVQLNIICN